MIRRFVGYAKKVEVASGFISRGQQNRKKVWANVIAPAEGKLKRPVRNPVELALQDKQATTKIGRDIRESLLTELKKGAQAAMRGEPYRFAKPIRVIYKRAGDSFAELVREKFDDLPPEKEPEKSGSSIPLVDTGKLRASVKSRFWGKARRRS